MAGLPVLPVDVEGALDLIWTDAAEGCGRTYVLVNGYSAQLRRGSQEYTRLLGEHDAVVPLPDGAPLAFGARLLGRKGFPRCPGPDLMEAAAERASLDSKRLYLLGGLQGVADTLADSLKQRFDGLQVAGTQSPPLGEWPDTLSHRLIEDVRTAGADILFLGVSAPKQEVWAHNHAGRLGIPVVCVGAAFDFLSGGKARAPRWMRTIGLEWVFRLVSEPRRLWKRYLFGNAVFVAAFLRHGGRQPLDTEGASR